MATGAHSCGRGTHVHAGPLGKETQRAKGALEEAEAPSENGSLNKWVLKLAVAPAMHYEKPALFCRNNHLHHQPSQQNAPDTLRMLSSTDIAAKGTRVKSYNPIMIPSEIKLKISDASYFTDIDEDLFHAQGLASLECLRE